MSKKVTAEGSAEHHASDRELASVLMRGQAALGMRVAIVFLVLILGIPMVNQFLPDLGLVPVLGFPLTWLVLGILFYPVTWALSFYFVRASERLEAESAELVRRERGGR